MSNSLASSFVESPHPDATGRLESTIPWRLPRSGDFLRALTSNLNLKMTFLYYSTLRDETFINNHYVYMGGPWFGPDGKLLPLEDQDKQIRVRLNRMDIDVTRLLIACH